MGKLNEIQKQMTQSYGDNAFTTTIKDDTVEFDSLKDKFTFKDEVEVPSLKVGGESVSSQVQADWNQNDSESPDYIKNRICGVTGEEPNYFVDTIITENVNYSNSFNWSQIIEKGETYNVTFNGNTYVSTAVEGSTIGTYPGTLCLPLDNKKWVLVCDYMKQYLSPYNGAILGNLPSYPFDVQVYTGGYEYETIDENFIPDTIARTSQLGGVQFKIEGSPAALMASLDGGTTWQTVTLS